jgi:carboxypeptidase Taq
MTFARIDAHCRRLEAFEHALSILRADEATHMPPGGGEKRAEAVAALASMHHSEASAPQVGDWIADAETETLDAEQQRALTEFRRSYINLTCLPSEFVHRRTVAAMRSEQLWRDLRPKNDWIGFLPALESVIDLVREEAALRSESLGLDPYDSLIEQYDPGSRAARIAPVFSELKSFLKDFVPEAIAHQDKLRTDHPPKPFNAPFPIERQRELGLSVMAALGFDFTRGRLDVSHHPFCGGVPDDVRMTTRYRTDEFLSALMGVMHETGHALYEQGLPKNWLHWPVGAARGMAVHESQSLFVERQIGCNPAFWEWALPQVREHLGPDAIDGWDIPDVLGHVLKVERSFIRVDADEVTYPLHIILRFELEQDLVSGKLAPVDIPEAWTAKMTEYLGLSTIDNPADGPMQDVHWPAGLFGYFPSYTLGAILAAQQWHAIEATGAHILDDMRKGHFEPLNAWRREHVWQEASNWPTDDLIERSTGEPLNPRYFMDHLKQRYLG